MRHDKALHKSTFTLLYFTMLIVLRYGISLSYVLGKWSVKIVACHKLARDSRGVGCQEMENIIRVIVCGLGC